MYWDDPFLGLSIGKTDQEELLTPWRGIAAETLPQQLKNQLKPH